MEVTSDRSLKRTVTHISSGVTQMATEYGQVTQRLKD